MKLSEAIKIFDENIPPPHDRMVDGEHMGIAIAWQVIKSRLAGQYEEPVQDKTEKPTALNCEICGAKMVWENPLIPGHWHESSCYPGDGHICVDCMDE